jgi:[acyl-carrier-protein] S-malonyltransferase
MATAFTFPGQGSQAVGMGKDLAAAFPEARAVFDEVDEALGEKLSAVIFEGPEDTDPDCQCPAGADGGVHGADPRA